MSDSDVKQSPALEAGATPESVGDAAASGAQTAESGPAGDAATDPSQPPGQETAQQQIERLTQQRGEAEDRALRSHAELENFRKRVRREMEDERKYAAMPVLRDLLPVVDDMDRAVAAAESSSDSEGLLSGVKMVRAQLDEVLQEHGCRRVEAQAAPFDPAVHEAIMQQPTSDHPPGTVIQVAKDGYLLHDRVVRPAQVVVSAAVDTDG